MKMLDPGSVVREGEFATAAKAAGLGETMIAAMKKVDNGDILTASMRQDFVDRSWKLYSEAARGFDTTSSEYVDLSKMYQGVDPSKVVTSDRRYKDDWFKPWFQGLGGNPADSEDEPGFLDSLFGGKPLPPPAVKPKNNPPSKLNSRYKQMMKDGLLNRTGK
jgi:hypothetical protein